jgi:hypothetical protein
MVDCRRFLDQASGVLSQLLKMQHIELCAEDWEFHQLITDPEAAQLAALTSSSQLTLLGLTFNRMPAGAVQHMFGAGRQLQRLQHLNIQVYDATGWNLEPGDISCIVACCPNLRCKCRSNVGVDISVGRISTSELQQLRQLTALSTLSIRIPSWDTAAAAVLADMTGGCLAVYCYIYNHGGCRCFKL